MKKWKIDYGPSPMVDCRLVGMDPNRILILDFGSQYTRLIARRVREAGAYCEIQTFARTAKEVRSLSPKGIILSGSPSSVTAAGSPELDSGILDLGIPVLGICYGMHSIAKAKGGSVIGDGGGEYGRVNLDIGDVHPFFRGIDIRPMTVWMSHGDRVERLPEGFRSIASTPNSPHAAMASADGRIIGVQFHPEVTHTPEGKTLIGNFVHSICGCEPTWTMESFIESQIEAIRGKVGDAGVMLGLSGGVDSSVAAVLLQCAVGDSLTCIFVDNGLLRKGEAKRVERIFRDSFRINLKVIDASARFLGKLEGVCDPEKKRKIIGSEFICVFEEEAGRMQGVKFLAQGTLYPDVIESVSLKGPSAVIKSHHNVGGLPGRIGLDLIEPFRDLFKDEVREVGRQLGLPEKIINRHPFPGPGLAVRIVGEVTRDRLDLLRDADEILLQEIESAGWYRRVWQAFCVFLPVKSVGVMGDERTYENVVAIRAVTSDDGMTADWAHLPDRLLGSISNRIIDEVRGINRVVYDVSSKPPATIEWE